MLFRKTPRLKDFDYADPNYVYFTTLCARHLTQPFNNKDLAHEVLKALFNLKEDRISVYCYCLMPDHFHIALSPAYENLSKTIGDFKSYTTRISWKFGIRGKLWQRSYYDHIARQDEDLISICQYILENPVRKGLAQTTEDWPYSGLLDPLPF